MSDHPQLSDEEMEALQEAMDSLPWWKRKYMVVSLLFILPLMIWAFGAAKLCETLRFQRGAQFFHWVAMIIPPLFTPNEIVEAAQQFD